MGMGRVETGSGGTPAGGIGGVGGVGEGGAGNLRRAEPGARTGLTLVELKVTLCELEERARCLADAESRASKGQRWAKRTEIRHQAERVADRIAEVRGRIAQAEALP